MIDRLAEIALGIGERLAGLAHHQRHEGRAVGLEQIGGAVEHACARLAAYAIPGVARSLGGIERAADRLGARRADRADNDAAVMRRGDP